jgi:sulfur-carrier protein
MATVNLPRSLVSLFGEQPPRRLELDATTLAELIGRLDEQWPGMTNRLCETGSQFREHINVFVDGQRVRALDTPLGSRSVVHIIPAVAGGATT